MSETTTAPTQTTRLADYIAEGLIASIGAYSNSNGGYAKFRIFFAEDQRAEAEAWAAQFPKSNKVVVTTCSGTDSNYYRPVTAADGNGRSEYVSKITGEVIGDYTSARYNEARWAAPYVTVDFNLIANGVTGDKNETAAKRLRSFLKNLDKLGISYTDSDKVGGAISMDELLTRFA